MIVTPPQRVALASMWCIAAAFGVAQAGCSPSSTSEWPPAHFSGSAERQPTPVQSIDPAVYRGAGLAHLGCPQCHDIGIAGAGPASNSGAPNFVVVANQEGMNAAKIERWMRYTHPTMPDYYMDDQTNSDLAAYIMSLHRQP